MSDDSYSNKGEEMSWMPCLLHNVGFVHGVSIVVLVIYFCQCDQAFHCVVSIKICSVVLVNEV